jgi:hypothetical protein
MCTDRSSHRLSSTAAQESQDGKAMLARTRRLVSCRRSSEMVMAEFAVNWTGPFGRQITVGGGRGKSISFEELGHRARHCPSPSHYVCVTFVNAVIAHDVSPLSSGFSTPFPPSRFSFTRRPYRRPVRLFHLGKQHTNKQTNKTNKQTDRQTEMPTRREMNIIPPAVALLVDL